MNDGTPSGGASAPTDSSQPDDKAHADIGLVAALNIEVAPFLQRCLGPRKYVGGDFIFRGGRYQEARVALVESGPGFARARRATLALIDAHTPRFVISCGFSGALQSDLAVGHIVMANEITDTHGHPFPLALEIPGQLPGRVHVGKLVVTDELVTSVEEKLALGQSHDALAVDMESLAVGQVCREAGIGFMAIRVISDDLSDDLPPEIQSVLAPTSGRRFGAALGALWKRPGSYKDLWKLREQAHYAADQLATFLDGVVEQLYDSIDPE